MSSLSEKAMYSPWAASRPVFCALAMLPVGLVDYGDAIVFCGVFVTY